MKTTIGHFLFARLKQIGIAHVLGVPGDFNLQLLEQVAEVEGIEFVGTCNELNAAYAADGYARSNSVSALLTTYGVGDLSALCGIAGAYAERVPVICISGVPPLFAISNRLRVHHSQVEGNFDDVMICAAQFTIAQTRLTPSNAVEEIDRVLRACWRERCPVYIQVPSNISYLTIEAPETPLDVSLPESDPERLELAVARIVAMLKSATRPAMLIDIDADRAGVAANLERLCSRCLSPRCPPARPFSTNSTRCFWVHMAASSPIPQWRRGSTVPIV